MAASFPIVNYLSSLSLTAPALQSPPPSSQLPLPSPSSPPFKTIKFQKPLSQVISKDSNSSLSPDLLSVLYPSAVYSNILFYNVEVFVEEDESIESVVYRFRREALRARVLQECKRRRWHETNQEKRKRKSREAAKRNSIRRRQQAIMQQQTENKQFKEANADADAEADAEADVDDDAEDNWEFGDADLK